MRLGSSLKFAVAGGLCLLFVSSVPGRADTGIVVTGGNVTERNHWLLPRSDGTYLLGYAEGVAFQNLYAQPLFADGTLAGDTWDMTQNWMFVASRSAAAYAPDWDHFLVVHEGFQVGSPDRELFVRLLDRHGDIMVGSFGGFELSDESNVGSVAVVYNSLAQEWLIVALVVDLSDPDLASIERGYVDRNAESFGWLGALVSEPQTLMRSVSLAYAPVVTPQSPTGWYLLAVNRASTSTLYMLGERGELIDAVWDCQQEPPVPVRLEIPFDWGTEDGHSYHPHVAYGGVGERKRFAVVWEDLNNTHNGYETTGIWGGWLDATHTRYCANVPDAEAFYVGGSCWHNFYWWAPRVAFDPGAGQFLAAWRELPTNDSCNDVTVEHIRGQRFGWPVDNIVLSRATGDEYPMFPDVASNGNGWLVTWDDLRNEGQGHQRDIYGRLFGGIIFADGFETGNTVRWSATVP